MKTTTTRLIHVKALVVGLAIGVAAFAAAAVASDSGNTSSDSPDWPSAGEIVKPSAGPEHPDDGAVYAHIGSPASAEVLSECEDRILQGQPPAGSSEVTADDVLNCKALLAAAEGRLAPGDYTHAELVAAVQEGGE